MPTIERMRDEYLIEAALEDRKSHLVVYTPRVTDKLGQPWAYKVAVDSTLIWELVLHEAAGYPNCGCYESKDFYEVWLEYYSVFHALRWVEKNHPEKCVFVCANSDALVSVANSNFEFSKRETPGCHELLELFSELSRLVHSLSVHFIPKAEWEVCTVR